MSEPRDPPDDAEPPPPPELKRRIRLYPAQWVGIPLLVLIPLLALLGVFDERRAQAADTGELLRLHVEYPARMRIGRSGSIEVHVHNVTPSVIDTVVVLFDPAYLSGFSSITFHPSPELAHEFRIANVLPDETRVLRVHISGERPWRHAGTIVAYRRDAEAARVPIATFVLP